MQVRAWLIQSAVGYLSELEPHYSRILQQYHIHQRDEFLLWLMRRELMEVYCLFEHRAIVMHPHAHYETTYQRLKEALPFEMHKCFSHYFRAPRIYDGSAIEVHLRRGNVVCIGYLTNLASYNPQR